VIRFCENVKISAYKIAKQTCQLPNKNCHVMLNMQELSTLLHNMKTDE